MGGPADVIVLGAGLAGCATAWHLARDHRVLVLEQGASPGAEATAQNAGMVRRLGEDPAERALAMRTHAFLTRPGDDWEGLSVSTVTGALLGLAHDPFYLHDAVAHVRQHGVQVEALSTADVTTRAPALRGTRLQQAWWLPEERVADPHALLTGYLRGLRRMNAEVRCGVRVLSLRSESGRIVGVETDQGSIDATQVVLAAGAWSATLAETVGVRRPLFPLRRSVLTTAPHPLSLRDHPWCWIDDEGLYIRPEAGGFLVSPCDEAVDPPRFGPGSRGSVQDLTRALAIDKLQRHMPALADLRFTGGWTGLRTFASDRCPILGADPDVRGLWWSTALGGFGVTCNYAVGEAVATWLRGEEVPWLHRDDVRPGRHLLRRFPIRPSGALHRPRLVDARRSPVRQPRFS